MEAVGEGNLKLGAGPMLAGPTTLARFGLRLGLRFLTGGPLQVLITMFRAVLSWLMLGSWTSMLERTLRTFFPVTWSSPSDCSLDTFLSISASRLLMLSM